MDCILLGTGGMMPLPHRLLGSLAVRLNGRVYLFDAGEGTQLGWKQVRLGVKGLRLIAITHLHADHCLGVPGLLMLKSQMTEPAPLTIVGPPGIEEFVRQNQRILNFHINYPLNFIQWSEESPDLAYCDDQIQLYWHPLNHTRFCLGYRLEELERPGKFDVNRAEALGIPKGPLWGKLQHGEMVVNRSGQEISPEQILGPARRGRHVAFVVDTRPTKNIYRLCKDVDIAFLEGMFLPEDSDHAEAKGHMTVVDAARIAGRAGAQSAILIHISPRYNDEELGRLEAVARERFGNARIGKDFEVYSIPFVP